MACCVTSAPCTSQHVHGVKNANLMHGLYSIKSRSCMAARRLYFTFKIPISHSKWHLVAGKPASWHWDLFDGDELGSCPQIWHIASEPENDGLVSEHICWRCWMSSKPSCWIIIPLEVFWYFWSNAVFQICRWPWQEVFHCCPYWCRPLQRISLRSSWAPYTITVWNLVADIKWFRHASLTKALK